MPLVLTFSLQSPLNRTFLENDGKGKRLFFLSEEAQEKKSHGFYLKESDIISRIKSELKWERFRYSQRAVMSKTQYSISRDGVGRGGVRLRIFKEQDDIQRKSLLCTANRTPFAVRGRRSFWLSLTGIQGPAWLSDGEGRSNAALMCSTGGPTWLSDVLSGMHPLVHLSTSLSSVTEKLQSKCPLWKCLGNERCGVDSKG
ncbi:hypothetical protein MJG53_018933 [Ovis ammon polii x Ovis aries]|uniref:Uncharacterized protein n=1 Tax=Ovis ammon polii x Ovis aries TaxID=2918886 RepID=A0ACB9U3Q0_9CETA|nr:hypothetical protein MJG53_018933 [Ovis ammon polii x Ovis aries]